MDEPSAVGAAPRRCEWCSAMASADAATCPGCGAVMPGGGSSAEELYVPGITDVAPHLKAAAARPLKVPAGHNPTHLAAASAVRLASQAGPAGALIGLGAVAAAAAVEWMGATKRAPNASLAGIDGLVASPPSPGQGLSHVLAELDGKWQAGAPGAPAAAPIPEQEIPDPPERPLR